MQRARELFQAGLGRWGWLFLLTLVPVVALLTPARSPVLLVVPLVLALQFRPARRPTPAEPRPGRRTPLDWPILLLMLMVLVSLWATYSIEVSLVKVGGMVLGAGLFYAVVAAGAVGAGRRVAAEVLTVYLLLGLGLAGLGLLGTQWGSKIPFLAAIAARLPGGLISLPGAEGGFQPNEIAGVLLWVSPLALALAVAGAWHWRPLSHRLGLGRTTLLVAALGLAALFTTGVLALTQSRSGLAGLALALGVMPLLAGRRVRWLTLLVLAIGAAALVVVFGDRLRELYVYAVYATATTSWPGRVFAGLDQRVEIWSRAVYAIQDFAFTGMGMNTFRKLVHVLYPLSLIGPDTDFGHAHNTWLQVALDLGLPGLIGYVGLWLGMLGMLYDVGRASPPTELRAVVIGLAGCLAASFAYGLTDTVALGARPGFMWWLLMGLVVLTWQRARAVAQPPGAPAPPADSAPPSPAGELA